MELSVYLGRPYTSQGIGKRLYCALIELLEKQGVKNVYGGVTLPNVKSEKLHLGLGFSCLGVYRRTGFKWPVARRSLVWKRNRPLYAGAYTLEIH